MLKFLASLLGDLTEELNNSNATGSSLLTAEIGSELSRNAACGQRKGPIRGLEEDIRTTPLILLDVKRAFDGQTEIQPASIPSSEVNCDDTGYRGDGGDDDDDDDQQEMKAEEASHQCQYGLLGYKIGNGGSHKDSVTSRVTQNDQILMNLSAPNSTFICGSQGAGKSYTLSTMLENLLLDKKLTGKQCAPVAALVFHYDGSSSMCTAETASMCSLGIPTRVLVSHSNFHNLEPKYRALAKNDELTVEPLLFQSADLSAERMLKMMACDEGKGSMPLYLEILQQVLRDMVMELDTDGQHKPFNYTIFKQRIIDQSKLSRGQKAPLKLRLQLLESFLDLKADSTRPSQLDLRPGTLTIIDLTDPFVNASTGCSLFDICLSIVQQWRTCGMAIVLDEAHKFMNRSGPAEAFTDRLLTTIREQRHNATRVIIATQEPTISESLLDLCSTTIVHRFSSPAWFETIKRHLPGASGTSLTWQEVFDRIIALNTGESLIFSPTSYLLMRNGEPTKLRSEVIQMRTRTRHGIDTGMSILTLPQTDY